MSHHSPEVDKQLTDALNEKFDRLLGERLGKTGEHPRGRLTPTDEGGIRIAVGSKNGAVVVDFGSPVAWIGFSPKEARDVAASLMKHADDIEGRCLSGSRCNAHNASGTQCSVVTPPHPGDHVFATEAKAP